METETRTEKKYTVLGKPDEVRPFEKGRVELFKAGGVTIGRAYFSPGWKWSTCVAPLAQTKSCQAEHVGYQLQGRMHVVFDDGSTCDLKAGDTFHLPAGHDAWVIGDEEVIALDFQGMADYAKPKTGAGKPQEGRDRKH